MAGKPAEPRDPAKVPDAPEAPDGARAQSAPTAPAQERLGPIVLTRMVKDDGRALLVYARAAGHA